MRFLKKIKVPAAYIMVLVFLSARVLSLHAETIADTEEPLPAVEKEVSSDIDTYLTEETFAEDFDLTQPAEADDLDLTQPAEADDFTEEGVSSLPEEGTPDDQVQPSPGAEEAPADQDRSESEAVPQEAELPVESPEESVEPVFIEEENQESADQYTGLQESADQYAETQVSVTETPGDLEEALILEEEAEEEIVIPVENGDINTDNDDLFASYVDRELELGEDLKTGTADTAPRQMLKAPLLRSRLASSRLNSYNQALYQVLLEGIRQVAAGTLTHTVFEVTPEEAGFADLRWSAEDLGVDDVVTRNGDGKATAINPDASAALKGILSFSFNAVNKALLADCPFDLYWFDKTGASTAVAFSIGAVRSGDIYSLKLSGVYTYRFLVSADYSASGEAGTYDVNEEIGSSVLEARENALSIVDQYKDLSDFEKLDAYRQEICDRTSYNYSALSNGDSYGDPWQLIWVLDDDRTNQVVCEGYSKAFQYLCDLSDFQEQVADCISVTGYLGNLDEIRDLIAQGEAKKSLLLTRGHMWNLVLLQDGRKYLVDITNCDGYTIGSGNGARDLFLIGLNTEEASTGFATGDSGSGYKVYTSKKSSGYTGYIYDDTAFSRFGQENLELSEGRICLDGWYGEGHAHVNVPFDSLAPTCIQTGHSDGKRCAVCGMYNTEYVEYPMTDHTWGSWAITKAPDFVAEGVETASCTVCGLEKTRPVDKLIHVESVSLDQTGLTMEAGSTQTLSASLLPDNACDKTVYWSSDRIDVATVSGTGRITAKNTGTATITATSVNGPYVSTASCTVEVVPQDLAGASLTLPSSAPVYSGARKEPAVTVKDAYGKVLVKDTDYTVEYKDNIEAGTDSASVTVTGKNNYTGKAAGSFSITKASQQLTVKAGSTGLKPGGSTTVTVSGAKGTLTYTSSASTVAAVSSKGKVTARKPGTAVITVKSGATDNYKAASAKVTIRATAIPLSDTGITASLSAKTYVYNRTARKPAVTVKYKAAVLKAGTDYTVAWKNNVHAGTGSAVITGRGNYSGTRTLKFTISRAPVGSAVITGLRSKVWTGKAQTQTPVVRIGSYTLKKGTDYTISYQNNINAGRAALVITGRGDYRGSCTKYFAINPAATALTNLTAGPGMISVRWMKQAGDITGYQIQFSSTGFRTQDIRELAGKWNTCLQIIPLRAKALYSVRIRTYKVSGGIKYYSAWSDIKTVRTK